VASVIYLTDTRYGQRAWNHPSARHRCYHYADALLAKGGNATVVPMERVTTAMLEGFDHAVFHRPTRNRRFLHAIGCCRTARLKLHADYDDLIFHPDFAVYSPQHINGSNVISKVRSQYNNTYLAAQCFDNFLVSTAYLADKLSNLFSKAKITVLPNSLPRIFKPPSVDKQPHGKFTIGYFPGSRGHGADLKSLAPVMKEVLGSKARLLVVGRMNPGDLAGIPNLMHLPFAGHGDYLKLLSHVDVSIAPLLNNQFNQSKSAVKLIESVTVGTPIIASINRDMSDHNNELSHLVSSAQEWRAALDHCLSQSVSGESGIDASVVEKLQQRFSVLSRMPPLLEHFQCVA